LRPNLGGFSCCSDLKTLRSFEYYKVDEKVKKLNVFLADLTHTETCIVSENIPLNLGLIKSYVIKRFGSEVDVTLYKYPEQFLKAINENKPDILGVSNYVWNSNISEWACNKTRELYPEILIVKGGWTFPMDDKEREKFLLKNKNTDVYLIHESELSFATVVEKFLAGGREAVFVKPIPGCAYIDHDQSPPALVVGQGQLYIENLDDIPSPYVTGILDEFFDGDLTPIIETMRGCPFHCNYCNSAIPYYSKVRSFSDQYVLEELDYIAKQIRIKGGGPLIICDSNFGMYPRDESVSERIANIRKDQNWPNSILLTTGKIKIEQVLRSVSHLKDMLVPSMSVQSMNPDTLKAIGRKNIEVSEYKTLTGYAKKLGLTVYAEVILSLPKETRETFWEGIKLLVDSGASKIIVYTLQMNYGTIYRVDKYCEEHGYKGKYRLIPNALGRYDGDIVFDVEKVAIRNNYLNFDDYLECRCFAFYIELFYNNYCFHEVTKLLNERGISTSDYMEAIRNNFNSADEALLKVRDSYINDTKNELFNTEEELISFYSNKDNFQKLIDGEIGGNVIYKHKSWIYSDLHDELIDFIIECTRKLLSSVTEGSIDQETDSILQDMEVYLKHKFYGILNDNAITDINSVSLKYDIKSWHEDSEKRPLQQYKNSTSYVFQYEGWQKILIREMFGRYGNSKIGKTKILAKTMLLQNLFRTSTRENR